MSNEYSIHTHTLIHWTLRLTQRTPTYAQRTLNVYQRMRDYEHMLEYADVKRYIM